jgi:hypothetical protein
LKKVRVLSWMVVDVIVGVALSWGLGHLVQHPMSRSAIAVIVGVGMSQLFLLAMGEL